MTFSHHYQIVKLPLKMREASLHLDVRVFLGRVLQFFFFLERYFVAHIYHILECSEFFKNLTFPLFSFMVLFGLCVLSPNPIRIQSYREYGYI